jgi:hypothetical protein
MKETYVDGSFDARLLPVDKKLLLALDDTERKDRLAVGIVSVADTEVSTSAELDLFLRSFHIKRFQ